MSETVTLGKLTKRNLELLENAKEFHREWEKSKKVVFGAFVLYVTCASITAMATLFSLIIAGSMFPTLSTAIEVLEVWGMLQVFGSSIILLGGSDKKTEPILNAFPVKHTTFSWEDALRRIADVRGKQALMMRAVIADFQTESFADGPNEKRREALQAIADMIEQDFAQNGPIGAGGTDVPLRLPDEMVQLIDSFGNRLIEQRLRASADLEVARVGLIAKRSDD